MKDSLNESNKLKDSQALHYTWFAIRLSVALILTITFIFVKVSFYPKLAIYLVAFFLAGYEVLWNALKNICKGKIFDENLLMIIAAIGAFAIGEMSEAVAVLIFYGVGEFLQDLAVDSSKKNISKLMDIRPDTANLVVGNEINIIKSENAKVGDILLVKPGERIPLDGIVISGDSLIDTSALTGESVPQLVKEGDTVLSGSVNTNKVLKISVTKEYGDSTVTKILNLVENASSKKAESEKFITKFAKVYTPIVVAIALIVAILPPLIGYGSFSSWIYRSLSFLIISCPCALVISIPVSFFGGIGGAARKGILVKGGNYLEALNFVDTLVFDKTGTLTKGVFKVTNIVAAEDITENELLEAAAICEEKSNHPIAKAIIKYYEKPINYDFAIEEKAGLGVIATNSKETILAGNAKLLGTVGIKDLPSFAETTVYVAKNGKYLGYILISDELKQNVSQAILNLKNCGINKITMLTGDNEKIANNIANIVGIDDCKSCLLPQDKLYEFEKIHALKGNKSNLAFVGDGINDAPVLSRADIGIAMGGIGADAAIEAADIVIMNDDISKIITAKKVAKKTRRIVFQNIFLALGVKLVVMILAFLGITNIWFAIFADVGVALLAVLNALRALR